MIDWSDFNQIKYHLYYDYQSQLYDYKETYNIKTNSIYCLSNYFCMKVIQAFTLDDLKFYFTYER